MFRKLYNQAESNERWLDMANLGINFLRKYAVNNGERAYFALNEQGKPLWKQRKIIEFRF